MILEDHRSHLANLVGLRVVSFPLQIRFLFDARFAEDVVTSMNSHLKSQVVQQIHTVVEPDVYIGGPA